MQLAWEAVLAQAQTNAMVMEGQRELVHIRRVMAEATLLAIREAHGCCEVPGQDDELQAWFHDAHGVAAIANASGYGFGNVHGSTPEPAGGGNYWGCLATMAIWMRKVPLLAVWWLLVAATLPLRRL